MEKKSDILRDKKGSDEKEWSERINVWGSVNPLDFLLASIKFRSTLRLF